MSIRYKLFFGFSVVLVLAACVAFYGLNAIASAGNLVVQLYDQSFMASNSARGAQVRFNEGRAAVERGLASQEAATKATIDAFTAAAKEVGEELKVVAERMGRSQPIDMVKTAQNAAKDWSTVGQAAIKGKGKGPADQAALATFMEKSNALADALDQVAEGASAFGFEFRSAAEASVTASHYRLIILAGVTGGMAVLIALAMGYSFTRPLQRAMRFSERVAAGDLSQETSTARRDEFGRLLASLEKMQQALRQQRDMESCVAEERARDHADQVVRRQQMEDRIASFRDQIGGIMNTITERMSVTAQSLSSNAREANGKAEEAVGAARETSDNVAAVAGAAEQLGLLVRNITAQLAEAKGVVDQATGAANSANDTVRELAASAQRIDAVVSLIRAIAEQTNLLALNATIEAARAGEAGRGFAVVASEVKALAMQTAKATEEISAQISSVQSSTGSAVDKIGSITTVMASIERLTNAIATAIEEQGAATQDIARNIQHAASATQNVTANVVGTTKAIGETNRAATDVLQATDHFATLRGSVDDFLRSVTAA